MKDGIYQYNEIGHGLHGKFFKVYNGRRNSSLRWGSLRDARVVRDADCTIDPDGFDRKSTFIEPLNIQKYRIIRPFSIIDILQNHNCHDVHVAASAYIEKCGLHSPLKIEDVKPEHYQWLKEKGYIEKVEHRFKCRRGDMFILDRTKHLIVCCSSRPIKCVFICMDGRHWGEPVEVKDTIHITRSEFAELCHGENTETVYATRIPYKGV